ncbi:MAG TPA: histidine phosphatase family protein [Saprospiraceae bacterium]|nr:histidine phosphatase family protein [Saprospiraceae bacterium]HPI05111.1 histidine phosphatase family protein [Saprospiraceae bacterium]
MRTLYIIRHAKSSWDNPGLRDFNRPLNERGFREAPMMAQLLVDQGIKPDLLVSSPAKRAITTALFFAEKFGIEENQVLREQDIYEAAPTDILRIISNLPDSATVVCLFGHNPTFTEVANLFSENYIDNIPTCGIVQIESEAEHWNTLYEGNSRVKARFFPKEVNR